MPEVALVDGEIVPLAHARVPVTDRGFLWGDHVFEVVRAVAGRAVDGEAHLDRLVASASRVRMPALDRAALGRELARTLAAAALDDAVARVIVTRGDSAGLAPRADAVPRLIIVVEPLPAAASWGGAARGVRLVSLDGHRDGLVPAAAKTGNYLGSVLALAIAADAGADDALLHDGDRVLETATATLLVVHGTDLLRPTGALLPGVTAARVCALLAARGHGIRDVAVTRADVAGATELLVTSARRGVAPVVALDGVARASGPVAAAAASAYESWLAAIRRDDRGVAADAGR